MRTDQVNKMNELKKVNIFIKKLGAELLLDNVILNEFLQVSF